jgi:hypothetical protein
MVMLDLTSQRRCFASNHYRFKLRKIFFQNQKPLLGILRICGINQTFIPDSNVPIFSIPEYTSADQVF